MKKIISIANQKGGVGKTTTVINLATALALRGKEVIILDMDPQANATSGLGIDKSKVEFSMYDVFLGSKKLDDVLLETDVSSMKLAPSNADLVAVEVELGKKENREVLLKSQIDSLTAQYDYILIDCPPSLGLLTLNAFTSSNSVLVPLQAEYYALEGVSSLMETMNAVREHLNKSLELEGVLMTMYDSRTNLSRQVKEEARAFFGDYMYDTMIPRNVKISESPSFGKPILLYDPQSSGALSYQSFAEEVQKRVDEENDNKEEEELKEEING